MSTWMNLPKWSKRPEMKSINGMVLLTARKPSVQSCIAAATFSCWDVNVPCTWRRHHWHSSRQLHCCFDRGSFVKEKQQVRQSKHKSFFFVQADWVPVGPGRSALQSAKRKVVYTSTEPLWKKNILDATWVDPGRNAHQSAKRKWRRHYGHYITCSMQTKQMQWRFGVTTNRGVR